MTRHGKQSGFTLVELMLAIAFIGFIILFTVLAVVQVMRTYNKGLTVKEINQTARNSVDDMARAARSSSNVVTTAIPAGRVCFGSVSYVWNYQGATTNKYDSVGNPSVTMARVNDPGNAMCAASSGVYPNVPAANATSLLTDRVWVQMLSVVPNTNTDLVTITMQLSTKEDVTNPTLLDPFPAAPPDPNNPATWVRCTGVGGSEFCATSTFSTTVSMGGQN
ncbi:MAG TPA: type II secretion system protein [Candidatus Saccharimonadales bacterium]|nr:type II secretion system protein [Candidatus Saccharimonadales bacterium]